MLLFSFVSFLNMQWPYFILIPSILFLLFFYFFSHVCLYVTSVVEFKLYPIAEMVHEKHFSPCKVAANNHSQEEIQDLNADLHRKPQLRY